ncbi:anaphase-promoting complex, subunit 10/DOC domain-containing protein, partial [Terfezia claveryi]
LKEIGNLASWTVSTAKPGCGVPELRSDDTSLFWQSDGPQPHTINIHFAKRVLIKLIRIYLDYKSDESYTPTKLAVMSGTGYHDLQEVCVMVLEEPLGWVEVDLGAGGGGCLRSWLVQVVILGNHQNGKDTHVRGLQVF